MGRPLGPCAPSVTVHSRYACGASQYDRQLLPGGFSLSAAARGTSKYRPVLSAARVSPTIATSQTYRRASIVASGYVRLPNVDQPGRHRVGRQSCRGHGCDTLGRWSRMPIEPFSSGSSHGRPKPCWPVAGRLIRTASRAPIRSSSESSSSRLARTGSPASSSILEGGPIVYGVELRLHGPCSVNRFRAIVGGEIGLRHAATARLLRELDVACEAHITHDLEDIFEDEGAERPVINDEASADRASDTLVAAVDAHALAFARRYADVDAVVAFIAEGQQTNRVPEFEYLFVPALLAASSRYDDARAALREYRQLPKSSPADEKEYGRFGDDLSAWIDDHAA